MDSYKDGELSWDASIKSALESNGMVNFYLCDCGKEHPFVYKRVFERLTDHFHNTAFEEIKLDTSKLRTYAKVKTEIGIEKYLVEIKNTEIRSKVTKLRLSNHRLAIETGRHVCPKIDKEKRFCPFCPNQVEDEYHFLFECSNMKHLREELLKPTMSAPGFEFFSKDIKLKTLISEPQYDTCKFIAKGMELREFLVSKPRNND